MNRIPANEIGRSWMAVAATLLLCLAFSPGLSQDNGIAVSEPKVFDNRVLLLKLEDLKRRLAAISVVDQLKLQQSLGLFQGSQTREVSRSLEVGMVPIPGASTTLKPNDRGVLAITEQTITKPEGSASAPTSPGHLPAPAFAAPFGVDAEDALKEQIDLTYQIYSLELLLERALSDRLVSTADGSKPRLQGLLNFQVTLDPPHEAKDAAAFVEITVEPIAGTGVLEKKTVSLVALMPQEKTYNATALSSKSNSFGGSAVLKILTVGYSEQRRGQTFYLYQDADTLTFRRMPRSTASPIPMDNQNPIFGWEFRPVLGRRSVSPGQKQMFAVIGLPSVDDLEGGANQPPSVRVKVKTYWRKYKKDRLTTSSENIDDPILASSEYSYTVEVPRSSSIDANLGPKLSSAKWYRTGDKSAVIVITGQNFYAGTRALLGDFTHHDAASGLVIKSSQQMQIETTQDALATGDVLLNGRYGASVPILIDVTALPAAINRTGIHILSAVSRVEPGRKLGTLTIELIGGMDPNREHTSLPLSAVPTEDYFPLIRFKSIAVPGPYRFRERQCSSDASKTCTLIHATISAELLTSDGVLTVRFPFLGPNWNKSMEFLGSPEAPLRLSKLRTAGSETIAAITGRIFGDGWKIHVGDKAIDPKVIEKSILTFPFAKADLDSTETIVVLPPFGGTPIFVPFKFKPEDVDVSLTAGQVVSIKANSASGVDFAGTALEKIKEVTFEGMSLQFSVKEKGTKITIYLTRKVTEKAGEIQVLLRSAEPNALPIPATISIN